MKKNKMKSIVIYIIIGIISCGGILFASKEKDIHVNSKRVQIEDKTLYVEPLKNDMKVIRPLENNIETYEKEITFTGMADPKDKVFINKQEIKTNFTGNFAESIELNEGNNAIKVESGTKAVSYNINKGFRIIDSVLPEKKAIVDSGTEFIIEAKLYDGAIAYAKLNGQKIPLVQVEKKDYINGRETCYAKFKGRFKVPNTENKMNLGKVEIFVDYDKRGASREGGEIIVNGSKDKKEIGLEVINYSAKIYDGNDMSYIPIENIGSLPMGANLKAKTKVLVDKKEYYNLDNGYRVKADDVVETNFEAVKEENIKEIEIKKEGKYTTLRAEGMFNNPFLLKVNGQEYKDEKIKDYTVEIPEFKEIEVTFNNKIPKIFFEENELFSKAEKKGEKTIKLTLKDGYYGCIPSYERDGTLNIKFKNKIKDIKGAKIVIDPGHGLTKEGTMDPGAIGFNGINEHDLNRGIAKKTSEILKRKGAEVILLDTTKTSYSLIERPEQAFINEADMFISIHNNSGGFGKLNANEVYYNTAFSKKLGLKINQSIVKTYVNEIFGGKEETYDRGTKWDYYTVILEKHCPSVLVEVGYVDNPKSFNQLLNSKRFGEAIAKGIEDYINK